MTSLNEKTLARDIKKKLENCSKVVLHYERKNTTRFVDGLYKVYNFKQGRTMLTYWFDEVEHKDSFYNQKVVARGDHIDFYIDKDTYVDSIEFIDNDGDCIFGFEVNTHFPDGGKYTFEGEVTIDISLTIK